MQLFKNWFLLGMVGVVALAWALPGPGTTGGMLHPEVSNKLGVALIFLLHGVTLPFQAIRAGTLLYKLHLLVQALTFLLFPLLGIGLMTISVGRVEPALVIGVFFLCALPSTVSSSVALTASARGNVPAAVFNATFSNLVGVVVTPLWLGFVLGAHGRGLPLGQVVLDLCLWLLLPLVIGQTVRPWFGAFAGRYKTSISVIDRGVILFLVYTSFCDSIEQGVWAKQGPGTLLYAAGTAALLLTLVILCSSQLSRLLGFRIEERIVAVFCGSKKTLAAGVPMAHLIFEADPNLGLILLPLLIYHPLQLIVGAWLAQRWATRPTRDDTSATASETG